MGFSTFQAQPETGLDNRTHLDRIELLSSDRPSSPHLCVKIRTYGDSGELCDMTATKVMEPIRGSGSGKRDVDKDKYVHPDARFQNQLRSARRAKQKVMRSCLTVQTDRMATLTTRANIQDRKQFFGLFVKWVRLVRKRFTGEFVYIAC